MNLGIMIPKISAILIIDMKLKKFRVNLHFLRDLTKKVGGAIVVAV